MKLFEKTAINAALKNISRSVTVTRQRVQQIAEQAVAYSIIHGDISVGNSLMEAISVNKSLRKDSLVTYLEKYGNFAYMKSDKKLAFFATYPKGAITPEHEQLFTSVRWDEAKRESEPVSIYDMEEAVRKFIDKLHKQSKEKGVTIEHADALVAVEQAFNKWSALNALKSMKVDETVVDQAAESEKVHAAKVAAAADAWEAAEKVDPVTLPVPVAA